MKNFLFLLFALLIVACSSKITSLNGTYENPSEAMMGRGHMELTFKPNGTVTVKEFGRSGPGEEHQYIVDNNQIKIQNFAVPLTMYKDGSLDGNVFGVFKKK